MMNRYIGILLIVLVLTVGITIELATPVAASTLLILYVVSTNRFKSCGWLKIK